MTSKVFPLAYFARLPAGKVALWCYLLWYLSTVWHYWDPNPRLWLNAAGISLIIGVALLLSVAPAGGARRDRWQTFRLFAMPFGVSSFSSLIKDQGFVLIFPPEPGEILRYVAACALFVAAVALIKWMRRVADRVQV